MYFIDQCLYARKGKNTTLERNKDPLISQKENLKLGNTKFMNKIVY